MAETCHECIAPYTRQLYVTSYCNTHNARRAQVAKCAQEVLASLQPLPEAARPESPTHPTCGSAAAPVEAEPVLAAAGEAALAPEAAAPEQDAAATPRSPAQVCMTSSSCSCEHVADDRATDTIELYTINLGCMDLLSALSNPAWLSFDFMPLNLCHKA